MVTMLSVKVVVVKDLEILVEASQIYLKNFFAVVLGANQDKEDHKEEMIFVIICQFLFKKHLQGKNHK